MNEPDLSGVDAAGVDQSGSGQSGVGQPSSGQSGFGESGVGQSGVGQSGVGQSGFGESAFGRPDSAMPDGNLPVIGPGLTGRAVAGRADMAISVRGLTKVFGGRAVVDGFDMDVPKGAIYGFLGPNGSGKTTTIRMMCGLLTPEAGTGTCLGLDVLTQSQAIKQRVGYMTQRFSLYEDLTIRENLDFVARMYRVADRKARVARALDDLGLAGRATQLAGSLSGGWKQRLSLAACLLHAPDLLLLDEPTAGVDPKARRDFWDEIRRLSARGVTVLVSTHYMDEAVQCDFIAYIAYGKKLISGPARDIPRMVGLHTWVVEGGDIAALEAALRADPGVAQVARFGAVLHVSSPDEARLLAAIGRHSGQWTKLEGGLEEAFIWLMSGAQDNFAQPVAPGVPR